MKKTLLVLGLMALALPACANHDNPNRTQACNAAYHRYHESQEALHSASKSLMECSVAGDINYDCAQDFDAVKRQWNQMAAVLRNQLHPACDKD